MSTINMNQKSTIFPEMTIGELFAKAKEDAKIKEQQKADYLRSIHSGWKPSTIPARVISSKPRRKKL